MNDSLPLLGPAAVGMPTIPVPIRLILGTDLSDGAKVMWICLYSNALSLQQPIFEMTTDQLAALTGASRPSVRKRLYELDEADWLNVTVVQGLSRPTIIEVRTPGNAVRVGD